MPVSTKHKSYDRNFPLWVKARDCAEGEHKVKDARSTYLPVPSGMVEGVKNQLPSITNPEPTVWKNAEADGAEDYDDYLERSSFYGAVGRTIEGLVGTVLRKEPEIGFPESKKDLLDNITVGGESFERLGRQIVRENVAVSRVGILVDARETEGVEEADPYAAMYVAEDIINWDEGVLRGIKRKTMVNLREFVATGGGDVFDKEKREQNRVLRLGVPALDAFSIIAENEWAFFGIEEKDRTEQNRPSFEELLSVYEMSREEATSVVYWQEIWVESDQTRSKKNVKEEEREYILEERIFPRKFGGRLLDSIPFEFVNSDDLDCAAKTPVLSDLCDLVISHYRNSADLEWGLHLCGLPTPYAAGFEVKKGKHLRIGGRTAWVTDQTGAKAGFVEFSGAGLGAISDAMDKKEKRAAVLGARLLEEQKSAAEAADTVRLRHTGEVSILAKISTMCSMALKKTLVTIATWRNFSEAEIASIEFSYSTNFNPAGLSGQELTSLVGALQSGSLSFPAYYAILDDAEMYPDGWTMEDEAAQIALGLPGGDSEEDDDPVDEEEESSEEDEEGSEEDDSDEEEENEAR